MKFFILLFNEVLIVVRIAGIPYCMSYGRPKSTLNFVRQGLPFIAIVSGAALFLAQAQKARYDFRQVKKEKETVDKLVRILSKEAYYHSFNCY